METPKPTCEFCSQPLRHDVPSCPRCGALVRFVEDAEEGVRAMMAVLQERGATAPQVRVSVVSAARRLVVGWDDDEMLRAGQVARILGVSRAAVTKMRERGAFPHARLVPTNRPDRYRRGQWRYPRRDVRAVLLGMRPPEGANDR